MTQTALLVIDVQNGMFRHSEQPHDGAGLLTRISDLVARARAATVPVFFIQHDGGPGHPLEKPNDGWRVHPGTGYRDGDRIVEKRHCDAFQDTDLQDRLQQLNIETLIITGMMTQYCVDTSCRRAFSLGYKVILVQDAHSCFATPTLTGAQIIQHHNDILGSGFAVLHPADDIEFSLEKVVP
jgi:nicotinamidase-related amidase